MASNPYDQKPEDTHGYKGGGKASEPRPVWSGPGAGWGTGHAASPDKRFPKVGASNAASTVDGTGGQDMDSDMVAHGYSDMDGDDYGSSSGSAEGHADCVPGAAGGWPGLK